jgi:hypothetical protein
MCKDDFGRCRKKADGLVEQAVGSKFRWPTSHAIVSNELEKRTVTVTTAVSKGNGGIMRGRGYLQDTAQLRQIQMPSSAAGPQEEGVYLVHIFAFIPGAIVFEDIADGFRDVDGRVLDMLKDLLLGICVIDDFQRQHGPKRTALDSRVQGILHACSQRWVRAVVV